MAVRTVGVRSAIDDGRTRYPARPPTERHERLWAKEEPSRVICAITRLAGPQRRCLMRSMRATGRAAALGFLPADWGDVGGSHGQNRRVSTSRERVRTPNRNSLRKLAIQRKTPRHVASAFIVRVGMRRATAACGNQRVPACSRWRTRQRLGTSSGSGEQAAFCPGYWSLWVWPLRRHVGCPPSRLWKFLLPTPKVVVDDVLAVDGEDQAVGVGLVRVLLLSQRPMRRST